MEKLFITLAISVGLLVLGGPANAFEIRIIKAPDSSSTQGYCWDRRGDVCKIVYQ